MQTVGLWRQLRRDLAVSWQKTAVLGALLLVGFYFWVPPLLKIASRLPGRSPAGSSSTSLPDAATASAVSPGQSPSTTPPPTEMPWEEFERALKTDPLLRSAPIHERDSSPFSLDTTQFSPPVMFEPESLESVAAIETASLSPVSMTPLDAKEGLPGVVLSSTIVSARRKAALINGRIVAQGSSFQLGDQHLELREVRSRSVLIAIEDHLVEIRLP